MKRRKFLHNGLAAAAAVLPVAGSIAKEDRRTTADRPFKLKFAPHDAMITQHDGKKFIEQLKGMHEQGSVAIVDNGMLQRSVEEQQKIGRELSRLGMTMGVFRVDGGDNWKASLTTGKQEFKNTSV